MTKWLGGGQAEIVSRGELDGALAGWWFLVVELETAGSCKTAEDSAQNLGL